MLKIPDFHCVNRQFVPRLKNPAAPGRKCRRNVSFLCDMNRPRQLISRADTEWQDANAKPSFEQLILRHLDGLYGLAFRLTKNREQAKDLLQESCLKACENFHQLRDVEKVKVWLFRILHRVLFNNYRRHRHDPPFVDIELDESLLEDTQEATAVNSLENLLDDEVQTAFDALPVEFREVIMLADIEELSYREIAEILNIPMGTVASRLYRGHSLLREKLMDYAKHHGYRLIKK
jgi:RNA polymerase sigma-70 factor (ECF subfamily)